ncbi:hypothetical protein NC653_037108 [Populus alba x Populus x berolinensis]|uniref:Uncharacterized protein n=1 Tax=Populus alba x Populus x berolinensis TaxID=444605 RepID=A0AAD6LLI0_9ROSI|nr:hypothetical protein NC653_037108 [Populus alba x Populus x berolinensis]
MTTQNNSELRWTTKIARTRCRTKQFFWASNKLPSSCAVDNVYYNVHEMKLKIPPEELLVTVSRLPALSPLEITDLPSFVQGMDSESEYSFLLNHVVGQFSNFREADWIFVNTFSTLEEEAVNWLASQRFNKANRTIDPIILLGQAAGGR